MPEGMTMAIADDALVSDEMVGLASYDRPDARVPAAEASFIVAGARQGQGVTTLSRRWIPSWPTMRSTP
jgi:hypothetical protein